MAEYGRRSRSTTLAELDPVLGLVGRLDGVQVRILPEARCRQPVIPRSAAKMPDVGSSSQQEYEATVTGECQCVVSHRPPAIVVETHHVLPLSWGGADEPANKIRICAQTHFTIHALLNEYVHAGGLPPTKVVARFSGYARRLAARAWAERIPGHTTPYWKAEHTHY